MAKVLSDKTAEWIKNQINSRNLRNKPRKSVVGSSGGSADKQYVVATVVDILGGGVYSIEYESTPGDTKTSTTELALLLANNLVSSAEYNIGDKILVHKHEFDIAPGGEE